jgi:5-methylthioadenosine/S-adenosylhomocysteine deaminase
MTQKLVRAGYVIADPSRLSSGGLIENGAVAVEDDRIAVVGSYAELSERYPDAETIGSERHVAIPGLVNTHHHGWGLTSFQLGAVDDYLESWIIDIWQLPLVDAYLDCLWGDLRNIRSGVTTLLHAAYGRDWSRYEGENRDKLRAHEASGIRVGYAVHALDQNLFVYRDDESFLGSLPADLAERIRRSLAEINPVGTDEFFRVLDALVSEYADHPRIKIMICPVAPQWCSDPLLRAIRERATEYGTGIHLHCLESPYQREFGRSSYGMSTVEHLHELGILGPDVSLGHAVWLTERDMEICAETGTSVCHNASSNLRLRVGILPAARMLEKGVNVSIGMDGTTLNDDEDMLQELRLVAKLHRAPRGLEYTACPTSADVLTMGTVNGARSITMESQIGKLEPGRKADIVLIADAFARPYIDSRAQLVDAILYRARGQDVDTVLIDGEVVLAGGRFTKVDEEAILRDLIASAEAAPDPKVRCWWEALQDLRPHVVRFYERWETPDYTPSYTIHSLE